MGKQGPWVFVSMAIVRYVQMPITKIPFCPRDLIMEEDVKQFSYFFAILTILNGDSHMACF